MQDSLITEYSAYKTFVIVITSYELFWLKKAVNTLINTPKNNRFFMENRENGQCMWLSKTQNKKGYLAEIFKVDDKGRKRCLLIPESVERKG